MREMPLLFWLGRLIIVVGASLSSRVYASTDPNEKLMAGDPVIPEADGSEPQQLPWSPASPGACSSSRFKVDSTVILVPALYDSPTKGSINMFVKRFATASDHINIHLIMLAGGPGQEGAVLESYLEDIANFLSTSVAFYLPDMRGVGQSDQIVPPGTNDWIDRVDEVASKSSFPLQSITLTNTARDILSLAQGIKKEPNFGAKSELALFGVSFGATWAYRTLQLDKEGLITKVILDSIAPLEGLVSSNADEGLIKNCQDHPYCREQFGGDATNVRQMLEDILNPATNECSANLVQILNEEQFHSQMKIKERFFLTMQSWLEGEVTINDRNHSTQLVLAFIKLTHSCHDAALHSRVLKSLLAGDLRASAGSTKAGDDSSSMNLLVNYTLFISEVYNMPGGERADCASPTINHLCFLFDIYSNNYRLLSKYVLRRDPIATDSFSTKAQVTVIAGEVDMQTPQRPALRYTNHIQGNVRQLVYRNRGHALISGGDCAGYIFREALVNGSRQETDACFKAANSVPLDWTFAKASSYRAWWDPTIPVQYIEDPVIPAWRGSKSQFPIWLIAVIIISGVIVVGGGIGGYYWYRSRRLSSLSKNIVISKAE